MKLLRALTLLGIPLVLILAVWLSPVAQGRAGYGTLVLPMANSRGDKEFACLVKDCPFNGSLRGFTSGEWYPNIRAGAEGLSNNTLPPKGRFFQ